MTSKKKNVFILTVMLALTGITVAQDTEQTHRMFRRGYSADIQLHINSYQQLYISTSHGFSFGNGLYIGGGAAFGAEFQPNFDADPLYLSSLFADGKYTLTKCPVAPFVALRTGYTLTIEDKPKGRFFVNPALGIDCGRISLRVGYEYQTTAKSIATLGVGFNF